MIRDRLIGTVRDYLARKDEAFRAYTGHYRTSRVDAAKPVPCPNCNAGAFTETPSMAGVKHITTCKACKTFTVWGYRP